MKLCRFDTQHSARFIVYSLGTDTNKLCCSEYGCYVSDSLVRKRNSAVRVAGTFQTTFSSRRKHQVDVSVSMPHQRPDRQTEVARMVGSELLFGCRFCRFSVFIFRFRLSGGSAAHYGSYIILLNISFYHLSDGKCHRI